MLASKDKVDKSDLNFVLPEEITVDSELSTTSENPVQNKVITAQLNNKVNTSTLTNYVKTTDLNTTLGDYYTKSETYSQAEVDAKIGQAGGGDVMASGDLAANYIIIGAGTKSIKNSGQLLSELALKSELPDLDSYATKNYVTTSLGDYLPLTGGTLSGSLQPQSGKALTLGQSGNYWYGAYVSTMHCSVIQFGSVGQLGTTTTPCTLAFLSGNSGESKGIRIDNQVINTDVLKALKSNGSATEFLAGDGTYRSAEFSLPVASDTVLGGIKIGYTESGGAEMAVFLTSDSKAYTYLRSTTISAALGYTPANVADIPEIPIALPNPYALSITANGSTNTYTGSSATSINLDNIYSRNLKGVNTPGEPGIYVGTETSYTISSVGVSASSPDAIVVVPANATVNITDSKCKLMDDIGDVTGTSSQYKCYAFTYISASLTLVNYALYG